MNRIRFPQRESWSTLVARPLSDFSAIQDIVLPILERVQQSGDEALLEFTEKFDGVKPASIAFPVPPIASIEPQLSASLKEAIRVAKANIWQFHQVQKEKERIIETMPGVLCWRKSVPMTRVGLYIPGGTAPLFSTLLMLGIPAIIAGCKEIIICTPLDKQGKIHPAILFIASLLGIKQIYGVGGAQAIAGMAFGTETIPKVDKIFGPGNQFVTVAKQLVNLSGTAIDMPAGPSEVAIFADESSNPAFVASDLLSQAEHGTDSQVILVSTAESMLCAVESELAIKLQQLPRKHIAKQVLENSLSILVSDTSEAMALLNFYAPEHLILATDKALQLATEISQAGSVFLGHFSPESAGDYASGTNHTLPTNGFARAYSGVSLDSFVKKITFQQLSESGLQRLGNTIITLAEAEGLQAHADAVRVRTKEATEIASESRVTTIHRTTNETDIHLSLNVDGIGKHTISTGIDFFDHMLSQVSRHSGCDLNLLSFGDLEIDEHHTIEDTALALGEAFFKALGDKRGIQRYGFFLLPMDDAKVELSLDFSGRPWLVWEASFEREKIGEMPTEMFYHFFKSFCDTAKCNLSIKLTGENEHHKIEATFKAFGKAIKMAVMRDFNNMEIPSTKGIL